MILEHWSSIAAAREQIAVTIVEQAERADHETWVSQQTGSEQVRPPPEREAESRAAEQDDRKELKRSREDRGK